MCSSDIGFFNEVIVAAGYDFMRTHIENGDVYISNNEAFELPVKERTKKLNEISKQIAENGANKKSAKEFTDIWGLEGMELLVRWSQWPEEGVKLKCKRTIETMEEKYPELKES